ncbi:MAG TPA: hypothetical protein VJQ78_03420 [Sphingobium sp.]|nr:hypothetical protein [Sphingobium sp.]
MPHNPLSYKGMFPLCSRFGMTDTPIGWSRKAGFSSRAARRFYMGAGGGSDDRGAAPDGGGRSGDRGNDHGA